MKILMTPVEAQKLENMNNKIRQRNFICPFCKTNKDVEEGCIYDIKGLFKKKKELYYGYKCKKCGGEWIGDPIMEINK